ncbi:hypothetical protein B0H14DRAFT_2568987 [Mycena olivaceomarginata]|nr:hypothetical protein B0H14DRAFT_2568987 [Mycena olivaceomarginata]
MTSKSFKRQNEAHTASINLQRHALDTSVYTARIAQLEAENKLLRAELTILRDNPAPSSSSSAWKGRGRRQEGAMWWLKERSLAAGQTSFVLDGHRRSVSGTGNVDADAGSTPTLVEPPVPAASPSAGEGPKDALDPTEALETRVAEPPLAPSSSSPSSPRKPSSSSWAPSSRAQSTSGGRKGGAGVESLLVFSFGWQGEGTDTVTFWLFLSLFLPSFRSLVLSFFPVSSSSPSISGRYTAAMERASGGAHISFRLYRCGCLPLDAVSLPELEDLEEESLEEQDA